MKLIWESVKQTALSFVTSPASRAWRLRKLAEWCNQKANALSPATWALKDE